jgi:hypothetical protein
MGVWSSTLQVKERLSTYMAVVTASPQKKLDSFFAFIMLLAHYCLVAASTTPFCCGA